MSKHFGIHSVPSAQMLISAGAGTSEREPLFCMQMDATRRDGGVRKEIPACSAWMEQEEVLILSNHFRPAKYDISLVSGILTLSAALRGFLWLRWVYQALSFTKCSCQIRRFSIFLLIHKSKIYKSFVNKVAMTEKLSAFVHLSDTWLVQWVSAAELSEWRYFRIVNYN